MPGGHESPSGAFKPQTGLRSKCRVFSAARARRFRRAGSDELRHPASASCLGRHSHPAGRCPNSSSLYPPLAAVVAVANKGLLAPFRPQRRSRSGKMLAASLKAFFALLRFAGPSAAAAAAPRRGAGCALSVTFGDTSPKGRGKKHSHHALGSPFGRAGAKRLRGFVLPPTRMLPQGASASRCRFPSRPFP